MPFLVTRDGTPDLTYAQTQRFYAPTRGVRGENGFLGELRAFALVLPGDTVFSHVTAAAIQEFPIDVPKKPPYHVTTPRTGSRGRREGLKWHRRHLDADELESWHGLPVTSPLRTWRDLAGCRSVTDLVVVADLLLRRQLCSAEALADVSGRYHAGILREAACLADGGSASPEETKMRFVILSEGLPRPTLNEHIIEDGIWIGCGDFVWREWKVIADYDGEHHASPGQRHQDAQTRDDYTASGWRHIAITSEMKRADAVTRIARALRDRGWLG